MIVSIDLKSSVPIYQQLRTALIAGILSGDIQEGDRLPSVRDLARDLGINLHTVHKVYGLLADDGYIAMSRNQGAIVEAPPALDGEGTRQFMDALRPLVIELRARNITKKQFDDMMSRLWHESVETSSRPRESVETGMQRKGNSHE